MNADIRDMPTPRAKPAGSCHHGDLKRALLAAALELVAEKGRLVDTDGQRPQPTSDSRSAIRRSIVGSVEVRRRNPRIACR